MLRLLTDPAVPSQRPASAAFGLATRCFCHKKLDATWGCASMTFEILCSLRQSRQIFHHSCRPITRHLWVLFELALYSSFGKCWASCLLVLTPWPVSNCSSVAGWASRPSFWPLERLWVPFDESWLIFGGSLTAHPSASMLISASAPPWRSFVGSFAVCLPVSALEFSQPRTW